MMCDCVRLCTSSARLSRTDLGRCRRPGQEMRWHRRPVRGESGGCSSVRAPAWCARPRPLDATIFNAVFSAPVGATLAFGRVLGAVARSRGADLVRRHADHVRHQRARPDHDGPARLEHAEDRRRLRLGQSHPRAAACASISNFGAALSAMIGATFWARYFAVFALGPVLDQPGRAARHSDT